MRRNVFRALLPLMALPLMVACPFQQEEDDTEKDILTLLALPEQMEINGNWKEGLTSDPPGYWAKHNIGASKSLFGEVSGYWIEDSSENEFGGVVNGVVVDFSNSKRVSYLQTPVPDWCAKQGDTYPNCTCFDAGVCYQRRLWTRFNGSFYYCDTVFNKTTLAEAKSDPGSPVNYANPTAAKSCGFASWTELKPR